jgi:outer membrane protein insertion porin family
MGFFDDVKVEAEELEGGLRLVYIVKEKPSVRAIQIEGMGDIDEDDIRNRIDFGEGTVFNPQAVSRNADNIRSLYEEEGFYTAQVVGRFEKVSDTEVDVIFEIQQGPKFFVRDITFVGNEGLSARKMRKIMATKERFFIPFLQAGVLKRSDLKQDVERIKAFSLDQGYLQVKVAEPEIHVDREDQRLDIVIRIEEGSRFHVGNVQVGGSKLFTPEELQADLKLPKQEFFSRDILRQDIAFLTGKYAELGYVFADIVPVTRVRPDETIVDVTLEVTEGIKTFVELIKIRGNTKTRDKVIRRYVPLAEGDVYNGILLQQARAALGGLGYFEAVEVKTARGSAPDKLVLTIDVKEKPTGKIGIGGGFSTSGGALGSVFLQEDNIFGLGKRMRLSAAIGTVTSALNFTWDDPFFLESEYSMHFAIFDRISDFDDFDEDRLGAEIRFGRRFLTYNTATLGYLYERVKISDVSPTASQEIRDEAERGTTNTSSINFGVNRVVLDNPGRPTRGYRAGLVGEVAGGFLGADNDFYKAILNAQYHYPLWKEFEVLGMIRGRGGLVKTFGDTVEVPLQERFFLGGSGSFRGSKFRELSPRDPVTLDRIGGNKFALLTVEAEFPIIKTFLNISGALFADAANVFREGKSFEFDMFYAFGVGVGVVTPFGPVRVDLAYNPDPTVKNGNEELLFHFNAGRAF